MKRKELGKGIYWVGVVDWDRRLFDSLIPLPDGTSYNAYLIEGSEKMALIDTVDPSFSERLLGKLEDVTRLDYIISLHAEQDHSGSIPEVLAKYPGAKVITNTKAKSILMDHLHIPEEAFIIVKDRETISLGEKTLRFIFTPWVHWPETMTVYLEEEKILFSCDFFGSHIATTDLYVTDRCQVYEAAKRYFAEIMMPFRSTIANNIKKISDYDISMIAPSHGPVYNDPGFIMDAYKDWIEGPLENTVVIPYVSMHGSTELLVKHLVTSLEQRGVKVELFNLAVTDIGKLAMALVDAATLVIGAPTVLTGPHPLIVYAAYLANALRPKTRFVSIIGSYGWGSKTIEILGGMIPNLKVEVIEPFLCKGLPTDTDFNAIEKLADVITMKHREIGLM